jgi:molecular chaperone DnaJ
MADLYASLGLRPDAAPEDIKRAYRAKAREHHPDAGGDAERFKEVTHAFEVLSDPDRRARYDRFGDDGTSSGRGAGDPFGFGGGFGGGIGDVIDAFFGSGFAGGFGAAGSGGGRREQPGRDVLAAVELTLAEVLVGAHRSLEIQVAGICDGCDGTGSADGAAPERCTTCGGAGQVRRAVRTPLGRMETATACPDCAGAGRRVSDPCRDCRGEGRRPLARTVEVDLPAGLEEGDRIPLRGQGEAGRQGARAGDLYVQVQVAAHPSLVRDGRTLHTRITVPLTMALLGGTVLVPMLAGDDHELAIPAGVQPGAVLSVSRGGLPVRGGGRPGDLMVHVDVEVPRRLDRAQRRLVEELAAARGEDGPAVRPIDVRRP